MSVLDRLAEVCPDGRGLLSQESVESFCALCRQHETSVRLGPAPPPPRVFPSPHNSPSLQPAAAPPCVTVVERTAEDRFLRRVSSQCGTVFRSWLARAVSDGEGPLAARLVRVAERLDLSLPGDLVGRLKQSSLVDTGKLLPATASFVRHLRVPPPTVPGCEPVKSVSGPPHLALGHDAGVHKRHRRASWTPLVVEASPTAYTIASHPSPLHPRLSCCGGCHAPERCCRRGAAQAQAPPLSARAANAVAAI